MLLAVSDVVWQALIAAALAAYLEYSRRTAIAAADRAAVKVADKLDESTATTAAETQNVASVLASTTAVQAAKTNALAAELKVNTAVTKETHGLVNSDRGVLLRVASVALSRLAEGGNPADVLAATDMMRQLEEHNRKQAAVDAAAADAEATLRAAEGDAEKGGER